MSEQGSKNYKILLVDDEAKVLASLKRCLLSIDSQLQIEIAKCGSEAIKKTETQEFDLIISDLRMPEIGGARFLGKVRRYNPETLRVILSGQASIEHLLEVLPVSHLYLEKPCARSQLKRLLDLITTTHSSRLPVAIYHQLLTLSALPCEGNILNKLREKHPGDDQKKYNEILNADLGIVASSIRLLANVSDQPLAENFTLEASSFPGGLLEQLLNSSLLTPLFANEELLRAVRIISIKARLLEQQLQAAEIESHRFISVLCYLGELALVQCIGADPAMLSNLIALRDEVTFLLAEMWGISKTILESLRDPDLLSLRDDIDLFFRFEDLETLSNFELLEIYTEVLCLTEY